MLRESMPQDRNRSKRGNLKEIIKKTITSLVVIVVFLIAKKVLAQPDLGLTDFGSQTALGTTDIRVIVGRIIQVFLGLLGMVTVVLIIYGGWLWMSAAGDATKIAKAKKTLINAIIGLLIILSSFAIAQFIIRGLISATTGIWGTAGTGAYSQPLSGSLGAGIISYHIPERGATAPRNTKIAIGFKEAIDETSLILDSDGSGVFGDNLDEVDKGTFKLVKTIVFKENNSNFKNIDDSELEDLIVKFTPDKKNFVFTPTEYLGSPSETISYTAYVTSDLKKADGSNAFSSNFGDGYVWEFQVEPKIDNTPPQITSIIPAQGVQPRNTLIQINFSEALDPTSASGDYTAAGGFQNITLAISGGGFLTGSYKIANAFRTIEFVTDDLCGTNSCGGDVYCLPENALIGGIVHAATVGIEPPQAVGFPYDGIVDLAGNSLDGNRDGSASGPSSQSGEEPYSWIGGSATTQGDDVAWQFNTSDLIDLVPPKIIEIIPGIDTSNVGIDTPVDITFNKIMSTLTLNNENVSMTHDVPDPYELWYTIVSEALDSLGQPVVAGTEPINTRASIKHGSFAPSEADGVQYYYFPSSNSKVQDLRQNCFNPSAGPSCTPTATQPYCCNGSLSATKCSYIP